MMNLEGWFQFAAKQEAAPALAYVYGSRHPVSPERYCRAHSHRSIEIVYHPTGSGVTRFDSRRAFNFREHGAVIYAPHEMHDQEMAAEGEDMCVHVAVPKNSAPLPATGLHIPNVDDPLLIEEIRILSQHGAQLNPGEQAIYNFRATAVLLSLIRLACSYDDRQKASPAEKRVLQAEQYIRDHFSVIVSVREVADHVGIGYDILRHTFKKLRKKSMVRYLNEVRVDRAKALIAHSKQSLKEIAPACGFNDEYYLSTVFRKITGTVPGHYRQSHR
jgi:AraC-like DNA-binding protein